MDINEIIAQETSAVKAKKKVAERISQNKAEIIRPIIEVIFDFLLKIHKNPDFTFSSEPHPTKGTPLFRNMQDFEWKKEHALKESEKGGAASVSLRQMGFGNNQSRYVRFKVGEDFKPIILFTPSSVGLPEVDKNQIFHSTEDAIRAMTQHFLKRSLAMRK